MISKTPPQTVWASIQRIWKNMPPARQLISRRTSMFVFLLLVYFWKRCTGNGAKREAEREVEDAPTYTIPEQLKLKDFTRKHKEPGTDEEWGQFCDMASVRYDETPKKKAGEEASCRCVCICHARYHEMFKFSRVLCRNAEEPAQFDRSVFETGCHVDIISVFIAR